MTGRHGEHPHPFLIIPRAGEREIRMRPVKLLPVTRGKEMDYAEK